MKKLFVFLTLLVSTQSFAKGWETITGNGKSKKEIREVTGYTGVVSSGSMNVEIAYGNSSSISVEADENLLPYIETSVVDGNLLIKAKKGYNLRSKAKMLVNVSLTKLTAVKLSGSGNISGDGAFTNSGKSVVEISGSGNIKLAFDKITALHTAVSGSGNIYLKGNHADNITASISGSGNIDCSNVHTNDVFANVSGSGDIKVNTSKSIDAKVYGSGSIYYKGNPASVASKASGSGRLVKM